MQRLAEAADAFGRDLDAPPLDEAGPTEARRAAEAFNCMQAAPAPPDRRAQPRARRRLARPAHAADAHAAACRAGRRRGAAHADQRRHRRHAGDGRSDARLPARPGRERSAGRASTSRRCCTAWSPTSRRSAAPVTLGGGHGAAPYPGRCRALQTRHRQPDRQRREVWPRGAASAVADAPGRAAHRRRGRRPRHPQADLERVVEPYVRLEASRSRATGGVGLGLAIARDAARLHGGELILENRTEGGLRATLILPRGG